MDIYIMEYVLAVADTGSFSLAAKRCHVGQPALSQQIAKLEKELGVSLFARTSRSVEVTEAGQEFVHRAREIIQQSEALRAEMFRYAGLHKGALNLGIITSLQCIDFGGMLSAFCGTYGDISVNITQGGTYRLLDMLSERTIDLAFLNKPVGHLSPVLDFIKLGEDHYSLAVPHLHPLAGRGQVSLKELAKEKFIFHQNGQVAAELCRIACQKAGFEPQVVCRSADPTTGLYMVQGGLGVAFLPSEEFCSRDISGIVELKITEPIIKEVGMAWRKDASSPVLDAAVRFAGDWVRQENQHKHQKRSNL